MFGIIVKNCCLIRRYTQNKKTIQSVIMKNVEAQEGDGTNGFLFRLRKMSLIGFEFMLRK